MSATPLLLCDAHHLAFRSFYGFPARVTSRDKQRDLTCVFGFFALLRAGIRDNLSGPAEILTVFDGEDVAPSARPPTRATRRTGPPEPPSRSKRSVT
jgi:DNA polymerase I